MTTHAELEDAALGWESIELRAIDALGLVREHLGARTALTGATATIDQLRATLRDLVAVASSVADGEATFTQWGELDEALARARTVMGVGSS